MVLESGSWSSSKLSDVVTVHVKGLNITLKIGMIGKQLKQIHVNNGSQWDKLRDSFLWLRRSNHCMLP